MKKYHTEKFMPALRHGRQRLAVRAADSRRRIGLNLSPAIVSSRQWAAHGANVAATAAARAWLKIIPAFRRGWAALRAGVDQGLVSLDGRIAAWSRAAGRFFATWPAVLAEGLVIARRLVLATRWFTPLTLAWLLGLIQVPVFLHQGEAPPMPLLLAYPEAVPAVRQTTAGWVYILANRHQVPYADHRLLPFDVRIDHMDLASVLAQPYPSGEVRLPVPEGREPGRLRHFDLLAAAYGATPRDVLANLEPVDFLGDRVLFNGKNGAAAALRDVARDIMADPGLLAGMKSVAQAHVDRRPSAGRRALENGKYISGWNWRTTAGSRRLSPHSFGIALDILDPGSRRPQYWRWQNPTALAADYTGTQPIQSWPWALIKIFERHGFIWGGKWHHFDTMHFEYRPEFFVRAAGKRAVASGPLPAGRSPNLSCAAPKRVGK